MATAHTTTTGKSASSQSLEVDIQQLLSIRLDAGKSDEGLTVLEWADTLGVSAQRMRKIFTKAFDMGILKKGRRITPAEQHFSGRNISQMVYKVVRDGD